MLQTNFTISFVLAVIGALIYGFAGNAKAAELGRIIFMCAFLWFAYQLSGGHVALR
jgi:Na+/phosphate symporter